MVTRIILLLITVVSSAFAQWKDMGEYLEIRASNYPVKQLIAPSNTSDFIIIDTANNYKRFNNKGVLIYEKNLNIPKWKFLRCTGDGSCAVYTRIFDTTIIYQYNTNTIRKYYLNSRTITDDIVILDTLLLTTNSNNNYLESRTIADIFYDYNLKNKKSTLFYTNSGGSSSAGGYNMYFMNIKNTVFKEDLSLGLVRLEGRDESYMGSGQPIWIDDYKKLNIHFDASSKIFEAANYHYMSYYEPGSIYALVPELFSLANTDSTFIGSLNDWLYFYRYGDSSSSLLDSISLNYKPITFTHSLRDKSLLISSPSNIINVFKLSEKVTIKQYNLLDTTPADIISFLGDSSGFLASNKHGDVKFFTWDTTFEKDLVIIKDSIDKKDTVTKLDSLKKSTPITQENLFKTYPNPCDDFINVSGRLNPNEFIFIYSTEGIQILETKNIYLIDVRHLAKGMYFIRMGNNISKFLKL